MNLDTNFLGDMLRSTDKAVPGKSDSDLQVPDMLLPVIEPLLTIDVCSASNALTAGSFIVEHQLNKTNDVAGSDPVCTMSRGLWTLDIFYSWLMLFPAGTFTARALLLTLDYQNFNIALLACDSQSGSTQRETGNRKVRLMLRENVTLSMNWQATGINDRWASQLSIVATKHL